MAVFGFVFSNSKRVSTFTNEGVHGRQFGSNLGPETVRLCDTLNLSLLHLSSPPNSYVHLPFFIHSIISSCLAIPSSVLALGRY